MVQVLEAGGSDQTSEDLLGQVFRLRPALHPSQKKGHQRPTEPCVQIGAQRAAAAESLVKSHLDYLAEPPPWSHHSAPLDGHRTSGKLRAASSVVRAARRGPA